MTKLSKLETVATTIASGLLANERISKGVYGFDAMGNRLEPDPDKTLAESAVRIATAIIKACEWQETKSTKP